MLDKMQCEFLLADNSLEDIIKFVEDTIKFKNVRLCFPPSEDLAGKIVLVVNDPTGRDDYVQLTDQHALRKAVKNERIALLVEEDLKQDYKSEIVEKAVKFNAENVRKIYEKLQEPLGYKCEVTEKMEGKVMYVTVAIAVDITKVDNKRKLMSDVQQTLCDAIQPHIVKTTKKPHQLS